MIRIEQSAEPIPGYRLIQRIGSGGFGEVWKAEAPGGLLKAIKILHGQLSELNTDGTENTLRHAEQELKALRRIQSIRHPYLLSLERYDIIENRLYIVMELAECNLWERFREYRAKKHPGIPRQELLQYLQEAAEVLDMMFFDHQLQHLDIKPQNLFLLQKHVKVADFGLVKELEGLQSAVTGGVTPVYAAPETLRGFVTPFCDQYSMAIVYQELLTGTRPFEGVNSAQLVMMHTHGSPNLAPLPANERAIVGRALSKIPENRFACCMDFVRALQGIQCDAAPQSDPPSGRLEKSPRHGSESQRPSDETPFPASNQRATDTFGAVPSPLRMKLTIPQITGEGSLRPTLIVGLGGTGLKVLKELRRTLVAEYGLPANTPNLRMLLIDTDPEKMEALRDEGYYPYLGKDEVVYARLNRSSYYIKPRRKGQPIIDGWFDRQLLNRIPRVPQTQGIRAFGRVAFIDHYRAIADKIEEAILQTSHPDNLARADKATKLGVWSNWPRVYVVAGLGGGTGGGMFIDVAHAVRLKLMQAGYPESEIVGIFQLPSVHRDELDETALANTYAGLRELHHFTQQPQSYSAIYDERDSVSHSHSPPFDRIHCLNYDGGASTSREGKAGRQACDSAVELLRKEVFSPLGRLADELRKRKGRLAPEGDTHCNSCESKAHTWPRTLVSQTLSDWLSATVISRWVADPTGVLDDKVRLWIAQRWNERGLTVESLSDVYKGEAAASLGKSLEAIIQEETQPLATKGKGWFARDPEPMAVWDVLTRIRSIFGHPDERAVATSLSTLEMAFQKRTDQLMATVPEAIAKVTTSLLEEPEYRLTGAIAANEMMTGRLNHICEQLEKSVLEQAGRANEAMRFLNLAATAEKVKAKSGMLIEAFTSFVNARLQGLYCRGIIQVYRAALEKLGAQSPDLAYNRRQLKDLHERLAENASRPLPAGKSPLLPFQARSLDEVVRCFQQSITPEEMVQLDLGMQNKIEKTCQLALEVAKKGKQVEASLQDIVEEEARAFIHRRLEEVDFSLVYTERFQNVREVADSVMDLFDSAEPPCRDSASAEREFCILGMPSSLRELLFDNGGALRLPLADVGHARAADEIYIYRECPGVSIKNLPQVGPFAEDAYLNSLHLGTSPHTRTDIPEWMDIESTAECPQRS